MVDALKLARARAETRLLDQDNDLSQRSAAATLEAQIVLGLSLLLALGALRVFFHRHVIAPLVGLTASLAKLLAGDSRVRFDHVDEANEIGDLARTLDDYRRVPLETEAQRWVKVGLGDLAGALHHADTLADFAQALLSKVAPMFSCGAAATYLRDDGSDRQRFLGGWGMDPLPAPDLGFAPGQGLIGQAAVEGKPLVVRGVPADQLQISTGFGAGGASVVMLVPILGQDREQGALAVVALATHAPPTDLQWQLIQALS